MRKLFLVGLMCLAGCQTIKSPFEPRGERADDPLLPAHEQQRKARYLHGLPDEELAPRTGVDRPGPHGR